MYVKKSAEVNGGLLFAYLFRFFCAAIAPAASCAAAAPAGVPCGFSLCAAANHEKQRQRNKRQNQIIGEFHHKNNPPIRYAA